MRRSKGQDRQDFDKGSNTQPSDTRLLGQELTTAPTVKSIGAETVTKPSGEEKGPTSKTTNIDAGVKKTRATKATERVAESKKKALPIAQQTSKEAERQGGSTSENEDATYIPTDDDDRRAQPRPRATGPQRLVQSRGSETLPEPLAIQAPQPAASGTQVVSGDPRNPATSWTKITPVYPGELKNGSVESELQAASLRLHQSENRARELTASVNTVVRSFVRQNEAEKKIPQLEEQLSRAFREITELRKDLDNEKKRSEAQLAKLNEQENTIAYYANNINLLTSVVNRILLGTPPSALSLPLQQPPLPSSGYQPQQDANAASGGHWQILSAGSTLNEGPAPGFSSSAPSNRRVQTSHFPLPTQVPQTASHLSTAFATHFNQAFRYNSPNPATSDSPQNVSAVSSHPMQTLLSEYQRSTMEFPPEMQQSPARDAAFAEMMVNSAAGPTAEVIRAIQGQSSIAATGAAVSENSNVGTPDWPSLSGKVGRPGDPVFQDQGAYVDDGFGNAPFLQGSSSSTTPTDFLSLSSNPPSVDFQAANLPAHNISGTRSHLVGPKESAEGHFGNGELYQQNGGTDTS
ncbi:hypothetical protein CC2G_006472 [Coprinopsis cinerea AmutBmut pab1-1]|nr:hypothetical protein CC2G_006472 [Coprinopsis cinerea AmutBmut pab1-1]